MTSLVNPNEIERLVGKPRHARAHWARWRDDNRIYILHSRVCFDTQVSLTDCQYSCALDRGISEDFPYDTPVLVAIDSQGFLTPAHIG